MRVLHVMAAQGNGGAELYSTDVMLSLQAAGLSQKAVLHPHAPRVAEMRAAGMDVETAPLRFPLRLGARLALRRLIARMRPDIIHCWLRRAAEIVPTGTGIPVIGWFGNYKDLRPFAHCDWFVGCTADMARSMRERGAPADRVAYIPTFPSVRPEAPVLRQSLDTPADAPVLLVLSRLHPAKGLETLLDALAALPRCHVWLAGEGNLRAALMAQAERLGIAGRVHFLGWRSDRGALLAAADICVLPSRYEPFGTVILDAWSADIPLVACAADGPRAHIRDGENGMLVPIDDVGALAGALRRVLDDPALAARIVSGGRRDYEAHFTPQAVTAQWLALYDRVLSAGCR
ncbi:glycosyltransferase [Komagataeibacter saccharivorans]|uniref:glycosyltransferase n=1 Tax=Komagataeibacter saccharivorans TaxID=265959 RepID=UPI000D7CE874|nr:glycosyltransferase [Komagataeibacter saccharivorans]PYD51614.1 glycosyltransferase [Komagataeibacter saccharivorans]